MFYSCLLHSVILDAFTYAVFTYLALLCPGLPSPEPIRGYSRRLCNVFANLSAVSQYYINKLKGVCSICRVTQQVHVKDGTVHKQDPRNNPCPGSHKPPMDNAMGLLASQQAPMLATHTAVW